MKTNAGIFKISTIKVGDRKQKQFETALSLNCKDIKIFELYETEKEAIQGHKKWVMKAKNMTLNDFKRHINLVEDYIITPFDIDEYLKKVRDI
ncbi:hypothetical protein [Clostridium novyi]|uniref:hypothetical protein n=1 Tax=Clostridium novyi TaxID=1542 RepID=UPI0004D75339|nr:hypothetical protein [Clostridium novyi]KEI08134.1 hypothetical protein Z958_p0014 [Clostridium novyi B str. NCTC 9691]